MNRIDSKRQRRLIADYNDRCSENLNQSLTIWQDTSGISAP